MIHIWVRATLDYDDEQAFREQLRPAFVAQVRLWDETFAMPYRVFRARVREIARENLARVQGAVCSSWEEIPPGALVLPADDDDWFRPDVVSVLGREARPEALGYRWTSSFLEVPVNLRHELGTLRARVLGQPASKYLCTTNNYALPASEDTRVLLQRHVRASRWVAAQPPGAVPMISERLSLMNRTIASQTSLGHLGKPVGRRRMLRKLPRYRELYCAPLPPALAWAQPHVTRMAGLMDELRLRER